MEKKEYIAPECLIVEMETVNILALSVPVEGSVGENESEDMGANRHRGEWGNLWGSGK